MTNTLWTNVKDELRERRELKARERRLREDLAHYTSPAEIEDLLAAVDREDASGAAAGDAPMIRAILEDNLRAHYARRTPVGHAAGL